MVGPEVQFCENRFQPFQPGGASHRSDLTCANGEGVVSPNQQVFSPAEKHLPTTGNDRYRRQIKNGIQIPGVKSSKSA